MRFNSVYVRMRAYVITTCNELNDCVKEIYSLKTSLSQSAVEAGMSSAMRESLKRFGNSVLKVSSSTTVDMT